MIGDDDDLDLALETRLADELRQQLDLQLGRAAPYFIQSCTAPTADRRSYRRRRRQLFVGFVATAAASSAILLAWNRSQAGKVPRVSVDAKVVAVQPDNVAGREESEDADHPPDLSPASQQPGSAASASPSESLILASALSTRTVDDGVRLVGRTPMRKIRRQWLERVEWFDPLNGARVQRIVPHEEIVFVPLPIN